jgi:Protein of unknown function (DUF3999)
MVTRRVCVSLAVAALAGAFASAQPATPQPAFRFERPVSPSSGGPQRLAIDVPLLVGGNPFAVQVRGVDGTTGEMIYTTGAGLTDLRMYDPSGREVAYLLVPNPPASPTWPAAAILPVAPVETDKIKTSGFEADLREAMLVDRFRVDGIAAPFLKRARLEGSGDREHWTLLAAEATVFDLPNEQLRRTEIQFTPGTYRYFRVTWDDTRSGRVALPAAALARVVATAVPAPALTAPVSFDRRASEPGHSRFRITLPGGHLPIVALELAVGGEHVLRPATVYESRLSGAEAAPMQLGAATLRRVVQDSVAAASLRVPIRPPTEAQLDLDVDDGDSPPLDLQGVTAVFAALPWIYFESGGTAVAARYGNTTLSAPRYDLEAMRDKVQIATVPAATWGDARARTAEENPALPAPPLPIVGAALDRSLFGYQRAIPSGDPGLVALPIDASVLAHSTNRRQRFGDVRIVDGDGRQIPYLVERASEPLSIDLTLERLSDLPKALADHRPPPSVYRIAWPFEQLPAPRLVLSTSARVFQRPVTIGIARDADRSHRDAWMQALATVVWSHADQERPTPALTIALPPEKISQLLVILDEGDNSPIPLTGAKLLLPAYRLRFFRERGASLSLAYGRADLDAPRYDLALLAPQLLGAAAMEVAPAAEERTGAATSAGELVSPRLFWGVLAVAVLVLLGMIVRLARRAEPVQRADPQG